MKSIVDEKGTIEEVAVVQPVDPDAEFGGPEERKKLERRLVWKIDCRMSILVLIYLLNYVRARLLKHRDLANWLVIRLTGIMPRAILYRL